MSAKESASYSLEKAENYLSFLNMQLQRSGYTEKERRKFHPVFLRFMLLILVQTGSNLIKIKNNIQQSMKEDELRIIQRLVQMNRNNPPEIEPKMGYAMELFRSNFTPFLKSLMRNSNFEERYCDENHISFINCYARAFEILAENFFLFLSKKGQKGDSTEETKLTDVSVTISYINKNPEESSVSQITDEASHKISSSSDEEKKGLKATSSDSGGEGSLQKSEKASEDSDEKENSSDGSPSSDSDEKGDTYDSKSKLMNSNEKDNTFSSIPRKNDDASHKISRSSEEAKKLHKKESSTDSGGEGSQDTSDKPSEDYDEKESSSDGSPSSDSDDKNDTYQSKPSNGNKKENVFVSISKQNDEASHKVSSSSEEEKKRQKKENSTDSGGEGSRDTSDKPSDEYDEKESSSDGSPSSDNEEKTTTFQEDIKAAIQKNKGNNIMIQSTEKGSLKSSSSADEGKKARWKEKWKPSNRYNENNSLSNVSTRFDSEDKKSTYQDKMHFSSQQEFAIPSQIINKVTKRAMSNTLEESEKRYEEESSDSVEGSSSSEKASSDDTSPGGSNEKESTSDGTPCSDSDEKGDAYQDDLKAGYSSKTDKEVISVLVEGISGIEKGKCQNSLSDAQTGRRKRVNFTFADCSDALNDESGRKKRSKKND